MLGIPNLLRQAWDATKLGVAIRNLKHERALVAAEKNPVQRFRPKEAIKEVRRLYEARQYETLIRLFLPDVIVDTVLDLVAFWWQVWDVYWLFVLLRIIAVFLPTNSGYIHPDEYFQSLEVTVGDVLEVESHRTWEFNTTQPLRSQTIPYCIYGLPLALLMHTDAWLHDLTGLSLFGPYVIHLLPRLILLALSFSIDFTVYQICRLFKHSFNQCLTTLASSYVMLVYSTRTFSNTLELLLFSALLYLVAYTMKRSDETVYLQEMVQAKYAEAETVRERVEIQKKKKLIPPHDFKYVVPIGVLCAVGFFNRPTFVLFAFCPLFFWFQRGIANHSMFTPFQIFNFRMLALLPVFVLSCLLLILSDSLYCGELTPTKLWELSMSWSDWKVAPYNFIMYNAVPGNLAAHGTHPRYTHLLVNLPLLLGPLAPIFVVGAASWLLDLFLLPWARKPGVRTVYALTLSASLLPLLVLSLVKHQEPRFLIPLLPCVVLMCAHKLRWKCFGYRPLLTLWYAFNIMGLAWFGFLHQAGVMPVQKFISGLHQNRTDVVNIAYSFTYMPPRYPLLQPRELGQDPHPPYITNPHTKYIIQELGSLDIDTVYSRVLDLISRSDYIAKKQHLKMKTYLVLPTFLVKRLHAISRNSLNFEELYVTGPHVSVESLEHFEIDLWDSRGVITPESFIIGSVTGLQGLTLSLLNVTIGEVAVVDVPLTLI